MKTLVLQITKVYKSVQTTVQKCTNGYYFVQYCFFTQNSYICISMFESEDSGERNFIVSNN